jgi:hypothetical protein
MGHCQWVYGLSKIGNDARGRHDKVLGAVPGKVVRLEM